MKLLPFSIKDISTYRSELMGWAILWIMMLHFTFNQIKPLGFIAQYGFAGVEIFMFVYYSFLQKKAITHLPHLLYIRYYCQYYTFQRQFTIISISLHDARLLDW